MPAISGKALKGGNVIAANLTAIIGIDKVEVSRAGAEVIVEYMQTITPVDTGELRDSEEVVDADDKKGVLIKAGADHASYVEFGTYKMRAQPYFRPAIDTKQKAALKAMAGKAGQLIKAKIKVS